MDVTAFYEMGLIKEQVVERSIILKNICQRYNGNFVIIWHNDKFIESEMIRTYNEILKG